MKNILLVANNQKLAEELKLALSSPQYAVLRIRYGKEAETIISTKSIDLCLIDVELADGSGLELCRSLRCIFHVPIILLSDAGEENDIIRGLESGADEFVTKPFSMKLLVCRIHCLLRRGKWDWVNGTEKSRCIFTGNLLIDLEHHMVFQNGTEVVLHHTEFLLCSSLACARGMILTRAALLKKIWEERDRMVEDSTLTVHICRLRKKLGRYQGEAYIRTVKGIGYRWNMKIK